MNESLYCACPPTRVCLQLQSKAKQKGSKKEKAAAEAGNMSTQDQENIDHNSMAAAPAEAQEAAAPAKGLAQYVGLTTSWQGLVPVHA